MEQVLKSIEQQAIARPDAVAVAEKTTELSYATLAHQSAVLAAALVAHAAQSGADHLGYLGTTDIELVVSLLAAHKAGLPYVHLDANQQNRQLSDICCHAGRMLLVTTPAHAERAVTLPHAALLLLPLAASPATQAEYQQPCNQQAISHIRYTSGSAGRPKGVPLTRAHVARMTAVFDRVLPASEQDRYGLFGHFWPLVIFRALSVGARIECFDFARQGAVELAAGMRERRVTALFSYPSLFRKLAEAADERLPDLHFVHLSGEPVYGDDIHTFERLAATDAVFHNSFGSSEYPWIAAYFYRRGDDIPAGAVPLGTPVFPAELRLLDSCGDVVNQGEVGEIVITSPDVPRGYHNDYERSAAVFLADPQQSGTTQYRTGDLARCDESGVLHLCGRKDEQVKVRGFVVRPADIECELARLPQLREAAVVSLSGWREESRLACHFVSPVYVSKDIREALQAALPAYMVPTEYLAHASLPRTATGKIDRVALLRLHAERAAGDSSGRQVGDAATATPVLARLARIWTQALGHSRFGDTDDFFAVGGDSLRAMSVLLDIERVFGVRIPNEALQLQGSTLRVLAELIDEPGAAATGGLVRLRNGQGEPLFLTPLIGGQFEAYLPFVKALKGGYPVLGLQPQGLAQDELAAASIAQLAEYGIATLRKSGHPPPWRLAGYSFGATVALEMARLMRPEAGERATLILIDPPPCWNRLSKLLRFVYAPLKERDMALAKRRVSALPVAARLRKPAQADAAHMAAWLSYRPQPLAHASNVLLVFASGNSRHSRIQRDWRGLLGDAINESYVAGDHLSMMEPAHVQLVAAHVDAHLAEELALPARM